MTKSAPTLCAAGTCLALLGVSGPPAQQPTFRSTVNGVVIEAFVQTGNVPADGLTAEDFRLLDNGVAQTLDVAPANRAALDLTLILETGFFVAQYVDPFKKAVTQLIASLGPDDRTRLVVFGSRVDQVWPMTPASGVPTGLPS